MKNVFILTGSARKNGTSFLLTEKFEEGALASNNKIKRYNYAFLNISPCKGCNYCRKNVELCVQNDDFNLIKNDLIESDAVVFVTPVYYFGMSAQLKTVIDRFHCISKKLAKKRRKSVLIATMVSPFS